MLHEPPSRLPRFQEHYISPLVQKEHRPLPRLYTRDPSRQRLSSGRPLAGRGETPFGEVRSPIAQGFHPELTERRPGGDAKRREPASGVGLGAGWLDRSSGATSGEPGVETLDGGGTPALPVVELRKDC